MKFNNRNIHISETAQIGKNVRIGDDTVIYDNVIIEDDTVICNNCVIGEPLADYYHTNNYRNPPTLIGRSSLIRSHAIIYAGCETGEQFSTGHRITVREYSVFGSFCRIGTSCDIQGYVKFGNCCWLLADLHICQKAVIGNFVFIYPYVIFTNDPYPPSGVYKGPVIGDFTQIAVSSVLLPAVEVGKHVIIGAGSVVTKNIADYSLVSGNPAKFVKDVRDIKHKTSHEQLYPWPYHFSRGMPWEKIGFEQWLLLNPEYS